MNTLLWQTGTPDVPDGQRETFWCAIKGHTGKVAHRTLYYLNRHEMPCSDQCEPSKDAEPVPNSDGDYYWTGWFQESCDHCDTQWAYGGEVVAWCRLPRLNTLP